MKMPWSALGALVAIGCGGDASTLSDTLSRVVGSQGGTLALPSGVRLEVPAAALDADVAVVIREVDDVVAAGYAAAPDFVAGGFLASVVLEPHGTTFASPVTLTIPFTGDPSEVVLLRVRDADDANWEPVGPVTFENGVATVSITTFSGYALARIAAGGCPCFTGRDMDLFLAEGRRATGGEPEARFNVRVSSGPAPSDASRCARTPNVARCRPAGDQRYLTLLHFEEATFFAYPKVEATIAPDGTLYGDASCETRAIGDASTPDDHARYFPEVPGDVVAVAWARPGSYFATRFALTTAAQVRACHALITRSTTRSVAQIGYDVTGLPAGEALLVAQAGQPPVALTENGALSWDFTPVDVGGTYDVAIVSQPTSATCVVADGTLQGTLTANTIIGFACAKPETCNGLDDDADGQTDEGFDADGDDITTCGPDGIAGNTDDDCNDDPAYTTDSDGDGLVDRCDPHPQLACPSFDLAKALDTRAQPGAVCLVDATGTQIPEVIRADVTAFTGVLVDYGGGIVEVAAALIDPTGAHAPYGCNEFSGTGPCHDAGRPILDDALSEVTEEEWDACHDVAAAACAAP